MLKHLLDAILFCNPKQFLDSLAISHQIGKGHKMDPKEKHSSASTGCLQQIVSSSLGATLTSLFVTPLDVIKVRLQAQQKELIKNKCYLYCNGTAMEQLCFCGTGAESTLREKWWPFSHPATQNTRSAQLTGTLDAFIKIGRGEGIASLWSGLSPTLAMAVPSTVIYFTIYDQTTSRICKRLDLKEKPIWVAIASGACARTVAATTISPIEMIRTKMQSQRLGYLEMSDVLKILIETEGIRGLWRGLGPTLLRDVPFSCIYWANYEALKKYFNQERPTFAFSFYSGASAGTVAAIITLPFDVAKTHRQIEIGSSSRPPQRRTTLQILQTIRLQAGIRGLFVGITPRIIKVAPACAIMISTYEFSKDFLARRKSITT